MDTCCCKMELLNQILNIIEDIEQDYPLEMDHAEDGRYTWPNRWSALRDYIERPEYI